ncbi:MAG: hypothetical protein ACRC9L_05930 [Brevinema sp.]
MLILNFPESEVYNEELNEFQKIKAVSLQLEHSLISLSKWESKWCKPFLAKNGKTVEETRDYVRCMSLTQAPEIVYQRLTNEQIDQISKYIDAPMTATTFNKMEMGSPSKEVITSELIYYWMIAQQIPFECQKWHLNRLLTLIRVCSVKTTPPKKMGKQALMTRNSKLNEERRKQLNTRG